MRMPQGPGSPAESLQEAHCPRIVSKVLPTTLSRESSLPEPPPHPPSRYARVAARCLAHGPLIHLFLTVTKLGSPSLLTRSVRLGSGRAVDVGRQCDSSSWPWSKKSPSLSESGLRTEAGQGDGKMGEGVEPSVESGLTSSVVPAPRAPLPCFRLVVLPGSVLCSPEVLMRYLVQQQQQHW